MPRRAPYPLLRPELRSRIAAGEAALARAMEAGSKAFPARTHIIGQEQDHAYMYIVRSGWLARTRQLLDGQRQMILVFLPEDLFGVKSLFLNRHPDTVVTLSDVTVSGLHQEEARRLAAANPDIALRLMFELGEEERQLHNWSVALGRPGLERVAFMLMEMHGRLEPLGLVEGGSFRIPMTQQDIGDRTGLSYVHVNRVLRELRERNLVTIDRGTATITDLLGLREVALPLLDMFDRDNPAFGAAG